MFLLLDLLELHSAVVAEQPLSTETLEHLKAT